MASYNTQILLIVFLGVVSLLLAGFFGYHAKLCLNNITTNEVIPQLFADVNTYICVCVYVYITPMEKRRHDKKQRNEMKKSQLLSSGSQTIIFDIDV